MSEEFDDRISMEEAGKRIRDFMDKLDSDGRYGYEFPEIKPGVQQIPAFDANYFQPGTMVVTSMDGYHDRIALICGYENGLQTMKLNEPWPSNECRPYEVSLDDYLNGRVLIKRLVKEE